MDLLASDTALPDLCGEQPQRPVMLPGDFIPFPRKDTSLRANTDIIPNMLCSKCKPIRVWLQHNQDVKTQALPQIFDHYDTGAGLEQGYLKGCHLCTLFWRSIIEELDHRNDRSERARGLEWARKERHIKVAIHRSDKPPRPSDGPLFLKISSDPSGGFLNGNRLELHLRQDDRRSLVGADLELSVSSLVALSAAPMSIITSSSSVLSLVARWLELCVTRHQNCKPAVNSASALPKRLLDLSEADRSNQLKVVSTDDSFLGVKYAAISYCWGNSTGYRLTSSTMTNLQAGIGIQELPQTIQDTIYVARRLGLRWLWVDSLCIIQDSFIDWAREAECMVDVYQNCFLCIAAIGAASSNLGLFAERDPLLYQPCQMTTDLGDRTIFAYPSRSPRDDLSVDFDYSALHMRGWALQERLLAPRTLSFGPRIFWECREHFCDETRMVDGLKKRGLKHDFSAMVLQNTGLFPLSDVSKQAIWTLWHEILEAYTRAKLTEKTDRLVALTGIIRAFERSTGWRNIDGLWGPFMIKDLAWCKNGHRHLDRALAGPSWSWIAVNGSVSVIGTTPVEDLACVEVLTDMRSGDGPNTRPHAMIRIICTPLKYTEVSPRASYGTLVDVHEDTAVQFSSDLAQSRSPEFFLPLVRLPRRHVYGLALVSSVCWPGSYERVGFVKVFGLHGPPPLAQALLDPARRETITLV